MKIPVVTEEPSPLLESEVISVLFDGAYIFGSGAKISKFKNTPLVLTYL